MEKYKKTIENMLNSNNIKDKENIIRKMLESDFQHSKITEEEYKELMDFLETKINEKEIEEKSSIETKEDFTEKSDKKQEFKNNLKINFVPIHNGHMYFEEQSKSAKEEKYK